METITTIERVSSGNAYKTQRKDETNKNMLEIIIKICNGILCLLLPLFSVYEMIKHPHKLYAICIRKPYVHLRSGVERKKMVYSISNENQQCTMHLFGEKL